MQLSKKAVRSVGARWRGRRREVRGFHCVGDLPRAPIIRGQGPETPCFLFEEEGGKLYNRKENDAGYCNRFAWLVAVESDGSDRCCYGEKRALGKIRPLGVFTGVVMLPRSYRFLFGFSMRWRASPRLDGVEYSTGRDMI